MLQEGKEWNVGLGVTSDDGVQVEGLAYSYIRLSDYFKSKQGQNGLLQGCYRKLLQDVLIHYRMP